MPLEFGRGAFIKLGEEATYGTIASSMPVDNRIISASFLFRKHKRRKEKHIYLNQVQEDFRMVILMPS
jgi:hypothetical protein